MVHLGKLTIQSNFLAVQWEGKLFVMEIGIISFKFGMWLSCELSFGNQRLPIGLGTTLSVFFLVCELSMTRTDNRDSGWQSYWG